MSNINFQFALKMHLRFQMLINLINEGYLPQDTITKLKRGEIDVEWIQRNVSKNPKFIMSKLPDKIRELIVSGQLPKHIEKAILSGKDNNETAMKQLLFQDDKVIKLLLPASIVDMLQVSRRFCKLSACRVQPRFLRGPPGLWDLGKEAPGSGILAFTYLVQKH